MLRGLDGASQADEENEFPARSVKVKDHGRLILLGDKAKRLIHATTGSQTTRTQHHRKLD